MKIFIDVPIIQYCSEKVFAERQNLQENAPDGSKSTFSKHIAEAVMF